MSYLISYVIAGLLIGIRSNYSSQVGTRKDVLDF